MKIPKGKVKVGAYEYKIVFKSKVKHKGKDLWGLCDRENHVIYLAKGMPEDRLMEVFLHETIHAIEESYDVHLGEKKTNMLGLALLALFKDNKIEI